MFFIVILNGNSAWWLVLAEVYQGVYTEISCYWNGYTLFNKLRAQTGLITNN